MSSPYDPHAFATRVNFAAKYISEGRRTTRHFDTCFEMHDGEVVATALFRRAQKNERLAANLFHYINETITRADVERYASISTRDLPNVAAALRQSRQDQFNKELAALKTAQEERRTA